jgi:isochorismate pyruvate lyase
MESDTLQEIRKKINNIDKQIVQLLGDRYLCVKNAASFKTATTEVKDQARVEEVISRVRHMALQNGMDSGIVEIIYRTMIDCFINSELDEFEKQQQNKRT